MAQPPTMDNIRSSRDTALGALEDALNSLGDAIAQTTQTGPYLSQLTKRYQDLMNEAATIRAAATDAVLALPGVIAAAAMLNTLSARMKTAAQALPNATNVVTGATAVLSLGQQFTDLIANAQKH
jgi:hypothetical protein